MKEHPGLYLDDAKGPLQSVALAVFGPDSFLTTWFQKAASNTLVNASIEGFPELCLGLAPFGNLFLNPEGFMDVRNFSSPEQQDISQSISYPCGFLNTVTPNAAVQAFLASFEQVSTERLENAFNGATFLANQAWMRYGSQDSPGFFGLSFDMGEDTQIPTISTAGIAAVSSLMAVYLAALFGLAIYAARAPRWTDQLDAFAMIRIGSALAHDVPFLAARDASSVKALDTLSGVIGDVVDEREKYGKLWPGGATPLRAKRAYYSYGHTYPTLRRNSGERPVG